MTREQVLAMSLLTRQAPLDRQGVNSLTAFCSKCGTQTSITQELIRNTTPWAPFQTHRTQPSVRVIA